MVLNESQLLLTLLRKGAASLSRHLCARVLAPYAHTSIMDDTQMLLLLPFLWQGSHPTDLTAGLRK